MVPLTEIGTVRFSARAGQNGAISHFSPSRAMECSSRARLHSDAFAEDAAPSPKKQYTLFTGIGAVVAQLPSPLQVDGVAQM